MSEREKEIEREEDMSVARQAQKLLAELGVYLKRKRHF